MVSFPLASITACAQRFNLIDGPITDVRDAYAWAKSTSRTGLQGMLKAKHTQIQVDMAKIVVIGWSTGIWL